MAWLILADGTLIDRHTYEKEPGARAYYGPLMPPGLVAARRVADELKEAQAAVKHSPMLHKAAADEIQAETKALIAASLQSEPPRPSTAWGRRDFF
jgi:hypothetical protein